MTNSVVPPTCLKREGAMATDTLDKLLEHVQLVYASVEEEQYYLFDKELEEEVKEYEKWASEVES